MASNGAGNPACFFRQKALLFLLADKILKRYFQVRR